MSAESNATEEKGFAGARGLDECKEPALADALEVEEEERRARVPVADGFPDDVPAAAVAEKEEEAIEGAAVDVVERIVAEGAGDSASPGVING